MATSAEDGDMVVTEEGCVFAGTRCEELGDQLVAEARSYHQGRLPHLAPGNLGVLFPKAVACEDTSGEDPPEDGSLEERGLRLARGEELQGSAKTNGYYIVRKDGESVSIIQCDASGRY